MISAIFLFIALLMFFLAWLVFRYPMLISGLSTMSEERRRLVDVDKVKSVTSKAMLVTAILHLILAVVALCLDNAVRWLVISSFVSIMCMAMAAGGLSIKYDKGKNAKRNGIIMNIILLCITIIVIATLFGLAGPPQITLSGSCLNIDGMYGGKIDVNDIDTAYLTTQYPKIKMRTNGFSDGKILYGHFKTDMGNVKLFIDRSLKTVIVIKTDGKYILFNKTSDEDTALLFNELIKAVKPACRIK